MAYIACEVKDEIDLFEFLGRHDVEWVRAEMATDWRYGGYAGFAGDNAIEVRTNTGETLDLDFEDEEIPEGKELDDTLKDALWLHMTCLVDGYFRRLYRNKEKYEATGNVVYNIPENTIEMDFLVRIRRTRQRADIQAKWNLGSDTLVVNNVRVYREDNKGLRWEKDHDIWAHFEAA
jgi:hypothetical protein